MAAPRMAKANLDAAARSAHGGISKQTVTLDGVTATRVVFGPGARWSADVAHVAGTPSCLAPHVAVVLSGRLRVRMDDGAEEDFGPSDVMLLPSGHDAWTLGEEPCVFVELSHGYEELGRHPRPAAPAPRHG